MTSSSLWSFHGRVIHVDGEGWEEFREALVASFDPSPLSSISGQSPGFVRHPGWQSIAVFDVARTPGPDRGSFGSQGKLPPSIPFTGLFVNPIIVDKVTSDPTLGLMREKELVIDVFGLVYKSPFVVRIEGWKPSFAVLVPMGVKGEVFAQRLQESSGASISCVCCTMPEFSSFQFGMNRTFVIVTMETRWPASERRTMVPKLETKKVVDSAVSLFSRCWSAVEGLNSGLEIEERGCYALTDDREITLHNEEKIHYPLRFAGALTMGEVGYHFMAQEDLPLVGHLTINEYSPFTPSKVGLRYSHGAIVHYESRWVEKMLRGSGEVGGLSPLSECGQKIVRRTPSSLEEKFERQMLCCSYDIETSLSRVRGHKFSDPREPGDSIMTIGMPIYRVWKNVPEVSIALLPDDHPTSPLPNAVVILCDGERGLLEAFIYFIRLLHLHVITGFNIDAFDNRYVFLRSQMHGISSKLVDAFSEYEVDGKVSFSDREKFKMDGSFREGLHRFESTQRATIDAFLRLAKLQPKEFQEGASLNKMLMWYKVKDPETQMDAHKMDLPIAKMYQLWGENQPDGVREVVKYCVIDARTTYLLLYWINFITEMFELSNTTYTTLLDSFHRAEGKRIGQSLLRYSMVNGVAFCNEVPPSGYRKPPIEGVIEGGDVRSFSPGLQYFVISLDYKSEYPAQKEAFNVGSPSKVPEEVIMDPASYGLRLIRRDTIIDQYCSPDGPWGSRERYWFTHSKSETETALELPGHQLLSMSNGMQPPIYEVQQFWAEATMKDGGMKQWKTYFVQSPRGPDGRITTHYSIQSQLLTDLRSERDRMKDMKAHADDQVKKLKASLGEMGRRSQFVPEGSAKPSDEVLDDERLRTESQIAKLEADSITFNSRQNATKVQMNAEYGTGNMDKSAHFDQDVAATVTWCARRLAEFLRRILTCREFILPDYVVTSKFLSLINEGWFKDGGLSKFGFILSPYHSSDETLCERGDGEEPPHDAWRHPDGSVIIDLGLITERRVVKKWFRLSSPSSSLTYQDTDSNYYRVPAITEYYSLVADPVERSKRVFHSLLDHNALYAMIVEGMVNRWPVAVSCDGGFFTAYWSPLKKQYMGVKTPISHQDVDKVNRDLLFPSLSDRREGEAVAQFLDRKKIKVAGYLIIRRETQPYVVDLLFSLLEKLLSLNESTDVLRVAEEIMERCVHMLRTATVKDAIKFSKQQKYMPTAKNEVHEIVARLRSENHPEFIPPEYSVVKYVLISDVSHSSDAYYARGIVQKGKKSTRLRLLTELAASSHARPELRATSSTARASMAIETNRGEERINLDAPYYTERMAKALANLVFEELLRRESEKHPEYRDILDEYIKTRSPVQDPEELLKTDPRPSIPIEGGKRGTTNDEKVHSKKVKTATSKVVTVAARILTSRFFTTQGVVSAHAKSFRNAVSLLGECISTSHTSQRSLQDILLVSFDTSTEVGKLAEEILRSEMVRAMRQIKRTESQVANCKNAIVSIGNESQRAEYIRSIALRCKMALTLSSRRLLTSYGEVLSFARKADSKFSGEVLRRRREGGRFDATAFIEAIPSEVKDTISLQVSQMGERVVSFREAVINWRSLQKAVEALSTAE